MEEKDLEKKRQHFVPQVYLRGFSPEYKVLNGSQVSNEKYTIYAYDLIKKAYDSEGPVPIPSICAKKYLYEIYGEDGKIIFPNWLENYFGMFEVMFGDFRSDLERKIFKDNLVTNLFTNKEKVFWVTFIAIHLLRNLYVLTETEVAIKETMNMNLSGKEIKSLARTLCLPFFQELSENSIEAKILESIITPMLNMEFVVGVDYSNQLITSDKGVSVIAKEFPAKEYDEIIFPITSSICLFLLGNENKDAHKDNTLFELSEAGKMHVSTNVIVDAYKKIYSNHKFSVLEKKYIKQIAAEL